MDYNLDNFSFSFSFFRTFEVGVDHTVTDDDLWQSPEPEPLPRRAKRSEVCQSAKSASLLAAAASLLPLLAGPRTSRAESEATAEPRVAVLQATFRLHVATCDASHVRALVTSFMNVRGKH